MVLKLFLALGSDPLDPTHLPVHMAGLVIEVKVRITSDGTPYPELAVGEVYRFPMWLGPSKRPYEVSDLLNHIALVLWCNVNTG